MSEQRLLQLEGRDLVRKPRAPKNEERKPTRLETLATEWADIQSRINSYGEEFPDPIEYHSPWNYERLQPLFEREQEIREETIREAVPQLRHRSETTRLLALFIPTSDLSTPIQKVESFLDQLQKLREEADRLFLFPAVRKLEEIESWLAFDFSANGEARGFSLGGTHARNLDRDHALTEMVRRLMNDCACSESEAIRRVSKTTSVFSIVTGDPANEVSPHALKKIFRKMKGLDYFRARAEAVGEIIASKKP